MIELELLGLSADGEALSLNDSAGNRYSLPITDELRATLRTDITPEEDSEPRPITPREIQAHFRAGLTVAEVSKLANIPPSQLTSLASPIYAERAYMAQQARSYRQGHEVGGMTLEELVISRLVPRNVDRNDIRWDAYREGDGPWKLTARYQAGNNSYQAVWKINTRSSSAEALNDEAAWLTETQIPAPTTPWRTVHTPSSTGRHTHPTPPSENEAAEVDKASSVDSLLDDANSRRGQAQDMPHFDGAHPAHSEPEAAVDATILPFPGSGYATEHTDRDSSAATEEVADTAAAEARADQGQDKLPIDTPSENEAHHEQPRKKRRQRPEMPSWDEIVFGYSRDD